MVGARRWTVLALGALLAACNAEPSVVGWTIELGEGVAEEDVVAMLVQVRRDDCEAPAFYRAELTPDSPQGPPPGALEPGTYALTGRVRTADCRWVAAGCVTFTVPDDMGPELVLTLERTEDEGLCSPAERCADGGECEPLFQDCAELSDGDSCSVQSGFLCLGGECVPSRCGDGYTDGERGEDCDDANNVDGDGCDDCVFSCDEVADCDDGNPCTRGDTCTVDHVCQPPEQIDDERACERQGGTMGVCRVGVCVSPACGDEILDEGEDCDDGNEVNGDGCDVGCIFSCEIDEQCLDGDACNGRESCDLATHTCVTPEPVDCDDGEPCTDDGCDPTSTEDDPCFHRLVDEDMDGVAPAVCASSELAGGDCDDADPARFAGATETCDGVDNDCDEAIDEAAVMAICFPDEDGDGYGRPTGAVSACSCAELEGNFVSSSNDCQDVPELAGDQVNPAVVTFASAPYCRPAGGTCTDSYDYDCDGFPTVRWKSLADCRCGVFRDGWADRVPDCGGSDRWVRCDTRFVEMMIDPMNPSLPKAGGGAIECFEVVGPERLQECR